MRPSHRDVLVLSAIAQGIFSGGIVAAGIFCTSEASIAFVVLHVVIFLTESPQRHCLQVVSHLAGNITNPIPATVLISQIIVATPAFDVTIIKHYTCMVPSDIEVGYGAASTKVHSG
jgi:hypothetical protein